MLFEQYFSNKKTKDMCERDRHCMIEDKKNSKFLRCNTKTRPDHIVEVTVFIKKGDKLQLIMLIIDKI